MPDRELECHERAVAVAEHRGVARQLERVHHAGDVAGVLRHRVQRHRRRGAEPGQVDARHAPPRGEGGQHEIEDGELGQQRMDEQQMWPGAALVVLDLRAAYAGERHYCSRFFAGGKSREYTGLARNSCGGYFQNWLTFG